MEQKIRFDYFYGKEADTFTFYRIPKLLFTEPMFKGLSSEAKILYGLLLDRMSLSIKNGWFDEEGRAYIYFAIEDIAELLNCGKNKAVRSLQELVDDTGIGLIEKKRQGQGKSNILYVKNFIIEEQNVISGDSEQNATGSEVYFSTFKNVEKGDCRIPLSLTVVRRKNRCIPCVYWVIAIFVVVLKYSNLFLPFTFFLYCFHFALCYKLIVCPKTTAFMKGIRNLFAFIQRDKSLFLYFGKIHCL